jgi:hypothetical protein
MIISAKNERPGWTCQPGRDRVAELKCPELFGAFAVAAIGVLASFRRISLDDPHAATDDPDASSLSAIDDRAFT